MQVLSYIRYGSELRPVEVELTLAPGLPQIIFLGLPDAALRESVLRIRTALRAQGFKLPRAKQILVQLGPSHLRKSSRGLDLAVAAAYLWETGQVPAPSVQKPVLYGELSLSGHVSVPDDALEITTTTSVYTGLSDEPLPFANIGLRNLSDLAQPPAEAAGAGDGAFRIIRPPPLAPRFAAEAGELAAVVAAGEHSALIAGPQGSGKTTLAGSIVSWIEAPRQTEDLRRIARLAGLSDVWRPQIRPHQSITPQAMIGGGTKPWAGEIHRADGGVLLMDEFLEFHPEIQEALRDPAEAGHVTIARGGVQKKFAARWLLLATTNLCRCGLFVPNATDDRCRCSNRKRRQHLSRLTGPFADRFSIIGFSDTWQKSKKSVSHGEISLRAEQAIRFRIDTRTQLKPNALLAGAEISQTLTPLQKLSFIDDLNSGSLRRREAVLRVARTFADLRADTMISDDDLHKATKLCVTGHRLLEACI